MSRPWRPVEAVLSASEALQLRHETEAELGSEAFRRKVVKAMQAAELCYKGEAFLLLGPSAAGKTTLLPKLPAPEGALVIDGSFIRQESCTWHKALSIARSRELSGFSDFFEKYFKPSMDKLKTAIMEESMRKHLNLVIVDSASNFSATEKSIEDLIQAGYSLRFTAVYGDEKELLRRGRARELAEGKRFSGKNWRRSVESIIRLQDYWKIGFTIIDNSSVPTSISVADLKARLPHRSRPCCCWMF